LEEYGFIKADKLAMEDIDAEIADARSARKLVPLIGREANTSPDLI